MNPWSNPDRFLTIKETALRRSESEDLVAEIATALSVAGEYVARIDVRLTQTIVDFNWAARQAARRLGIRVDVKSQLIKADGELHVRVTTLNPPS